MDLRQKRVTPAPEVLVRELHGESVLLDLASECYFGLDGVGTGMWEALTRGRSIQSAYELLLDTFEVEPEELREDMLGFVSQLQSAGLIDVLDVEA